MKNKSFGYMLLISAYIYKKWNWTGELTHPVSHNSHRMKVFIGSYTVWESEIKIPGHWPSSSQHRARLDAMCAVNFQSRQNFQFLWERLSFSWMIFIYYHDDCLWLFNRLSFSGINAAKWIIINTFGIILIFLIGNSSDFLLANKFFIFTFNFFFVIYTKIFAVINNLNK